MDLINASKNGASGNTASVKTPRLALLAAVAIQNTSGRPLRPSKTHHAFLVASPLALALPNQSHDHDIDNE
jgi:hypothetical protein